jgi:hypothetical protein
MLFLGKLVNVYLTTNTSDIAPVFVVIAFFPIAGKHV